MDLTLDFHIIAGIGASGLALGLFLRDPARRQNRLFALLCVSLAVWNLGVAGRRLFPGVVPWDQILLLGSCFSAPLGLHFVCHFVGESGPIRKRVLPAAYAFAVALWSASWFFYTSARRAWDLAALAILGSTLLVALIVLVRRFRTLTVGSERFAFGWLIVGAVAAIAGGMSDFLPRSGSGIPRVGVLFLMFFLLIICAIVLRYRFLDVNIILARALAVLLASFLATLFLHEVVRVAGNRFLTLFLAVVVILTAVVPLWQGLISGARSVLRSGDPLAPALMDTSRRLPLARHRPDLWRALDRSSRTLAENARFAIHLRQPGEGGYRAIYPPASPETARDESGDDAIAAVLADEREPVTLRYLESERRDKRDVDLPTILTAIEAMTRSGFQLLVPLHRGDDLAGWIGVGGGLLSRHLTAEVAAAFLAIGNQVLASLERIDAEENSRRQVAMATVGRMAAGLAHEIRNPLGAIRGAVQVLGDGESSERAGEMHAVIEEETERLGRVVGEFLDYAKPGELVRRRVEIGELIDRVIRSARAAGKGMRFEVDIAEDAGVIMGDDDQLHRALANLVDNAHDAAGPSGRLRIGVTSSGNAGTTIVIEDNGPGIPEDEVMEVFTPFHTTKPGGTGLGLALVHRVVEAHGGSITVQGRPGRGAMFTVNLPQADEEAP